MLFCTMEVYKLEIPGDETVLMDWGTPRRSQDVNGRTALRVRAARELNSKEEKRVHLKCTHLQ